jgi:ABC-type glycerol-3-phosphate transport system substrate-binding protein
MPRTIVILLLAALAAAARAAPPREVILWQAVDPGLARELASAAARFNASQVEFHVTLRPAAAGVPASAGKVALPFSTERPVLYYNRDAFRLARLDARKPPRTWYEMARTLGALADSGQACGYTTAWPSSVLLAANGGEFDRQLLVRWVSMLASWQTAGYFSYSGKLDEAEARFASGECAMVTASSASRSELARRARFDVGVAALPRYDDFAAGAARPPGARALLWAEPRSVGVASFFAFLAQRSAALRRQREAIDGALEAVWTGRRTPVDALSLVSY